MSSSTNIAKPIHPFPARMAADIALKELASFPPRSLILDPMAGSGTVLRAAAEQGYKGLGFDLDPLAVLMTKVWTTYVRPDELCDAACRVTARAQNVSSEEPPNRSATALSCGLSSITSTVLSPTLPSMAPNTANPAVQARSVPRCSRQAERASQPGRGHRGPGRRDAAAHGEVEEAPFAVGRGRGGLIRKPVEGLRPRRVRE